MTHRLPTRGLSMTKIFDRINTQSEGIVAQWSTLDDHDKAISDLWDECARVEQATASRVNNRHTETAMALDNLDRVTADLLARVRDLELVVATEAKPRIVGRELTPEQAAARDALREALRPAVERELAKLTDQRRQQAAQELVVATEVTPRIVQDGSRLAGMAVYNTKEATRGDRDWALLALKRLREWAGILAGIGWQLPSCEILPLDPAEQHLRQAHDAVTRAQIGWETTLPGPLGQITDDIAVAIGHLKAWLTATAPPQAARESQEQAPAPKLAPEDTGTATPRLTQRQRLVRADWALVWAQRHEGDRRRHDVVVALDWLREWADEAEVDTDDRLLPSDPDWHLREARKLIREELEDDPRSELPMRTAIAHLKALLTTLGLLTLEPEPEPEQDTPDPDELLTLAMKHVDRARDGDACTVDRACPLVDRLRIDHCDREHVLQALDLLRAWQCAAGVDKRDYSAHVHWTSPEAQLSAAAWSIEYGLRWAHERGTCVGLAIARLERWQEQQPDDDVISAEILDADAAAEMPTLPPDPTPTQRAGRMISSIEDAARGVKVAGHLYIPHGITAADAIAEAMACVIAPMGYGGGARARRSLPTAWVWLDVAQRTIPGHGQCRTVVTHDATECSHHLTPETWDPLEGAMMDLLWAHSAARNGRANGPVRTCEQLLAARCALRTWWEMPR